jgi:N-acetylglucosaminyldiphosphoundecaprenol N-acetyl-beta-D-mannosaminyltransferase
LEFRFGADVIGVNISDNATLMATLHARFASRQGFALATINLDHLVKLRRSEGFRKSYLAQDLVVADGNPIVWLSRLAARPVSLIPGSDLVLPVARLAARDGVSIALMGSTGEALARAAKSLTAAVPGLKVVLQTAPPMGFDPTGPDAIRIVKQIAASGAGLCFIALGAPKQEAFAALGRQLAPSVGFASIGAGLDFLAGSQTRAPQMVQHLAMEWLWRALQSPRRMIPRYLACAALLPSEMLAAWRLRGAKGSI